VAKGQNVSDRGQSLVLYFALHYNDARMPGCSDARVPGADPA
jgi:hypothetical protein